MIEKYGLFDSLEGDVREYAEADFALLVSALGRDGVSGGKESLKVSAAVSGLGVSVKPGYALVQGRYYALEDDGSGDMTLGLTAASAYPRIDRIVLTLNYAQRTVKLGVLRGVEAALPAAPALVRNTAEYMLSLAQVYVGVGAGTLRETDVQDERGDADLCGMEGADAAQAIQKAQEALHEAEKAQQLARQALDAPCVTSLAGKTGDVQLEAGTGISVSGLKIANTGVHAVETGAQEGTIRIHTNGAQADVPVAGWMQAFAKKLDAGKIQLGSVSVAVNQYQEDASNPLRNNYTARVQFPTPMETAPAGVFTSTITTDPQRRRSSASNVTADGFDCCVYNGTSAGTMWVYWLAIWE